MNRRTIRRYAHELHPHANEHETRPLAVEVPYLYARAIGLDTWGTGWRETSPKEHADRVNEMVEARRLALVADALLQGLTGDEAWEWADSRSWDETGEWVYQRARHYGVDPDRVKPYPCGPEPDHHDHLGDPHPKWGWREITRVDGPEFECPDCTEELAEARGFSGGAR